MSFFNPKEEVIEIELTQYGKHLLSKGKWKPVYYAFYDDDIIYDGKYAGLLETSSEAVERIKEAPRTKTQYVFTGIEEQVKKNLQLIKDSKELLNSSKLLPKEEKHYALTQPLGNSTLGERKSPAFLLNVLKGQISSSLVLQTGEQPNLRIPQIKLEDTIYKRKIQKFNPDFNYSAYGTQDINRTRVFEDGNLISIHQDYILLELFEKNVDNLNKNYDIELFLVEENENGEENFTQLHFDEVKENYKNGILLDSEEDDITLSTRKAEEESLRISDPYRATNFFDILIDNQIGEDVLCEMSTKTSDGIDSMYAMGIDCEDVAASAKKTDMLNPANLIYRSSYDEEDTNKC